MNRWGKLFEEIEIEWNTLKEIVSQLEEVELDDETTAIEVARFQRVFVFIDELIQQLDSDLITTNFKPLISSVTSNLNTFFTGKNPAHIKSANDHLDKVLNAISPFIYNSPKSAKSAQKAFHSYKNTISRGLNSFKSENDKLLKELEENKEKSNQLLDEISQMQTKIDELQSHYFYGSSDEYSVQESVNNLVNDFEQKHIEIEKLYGQLLEGEDSIQQKILEFKDSALVNEAEISEINKNISNEVESLRKFYNRVVGEKDDEGNTVAGLQFELDERNKVLDTFKERQEERYKALNKQIEDLLPKATSAGLAGAYQDQKDSYKIAIIAHSIIFYLSVVIVFGLSVWVFNSVPNTELNTSNTQILSEFLHKIPFLIPPIWLALFSSKRRSELERLKQEYAHKETLTKSYESFKHQIEQLDNENKELLLDKLLSSAIDTVAENASKTLDKKHGDKLPIQELAEKIVEQTSSLVKLKEKGGNR